MGTLRGPWQELLAPPGVPARVEQPCVWRTWGYAVAWGLSAPPPGGSWLPKASRQCVASLPAAGALVEDSALLAGLCDSVET